MLSTSTEHNFPPLRPDHADALLEIVAGESESIRRIHAETFSWLQREDLVEGRIPTPKGRQRVWMDDDLYPRLPDAKKFVPRTDFASQHVSFVNAIITAIGDAPGSKLQSDALLRELDVTAEIWNKAVARVVKAQPLKLFTFDRVSKTFSLTEPGLARYRLICDEQKIEETEKIAKIATNEVLRVTPERLRAVANVLYVASRLPGFNGLLKKRDAHIALQFLGLDPIYAGLFWRELRESGVVVRADTRLAARNSLSRLADDFKPSETFNEEQVRAAFADTLNPPHPVTISGEQGTISTLRLYEMLRMFEHDCRRQGMQAFANTFRKTLLSGHGIKIGQSVVMAFLAELESLGLATVGKEDKGSLHEPRVYFKLIGDVDNPSFDRRDMPPVSPKRKKSRPRPFA